MKLTIFLLSAWVVLAWAEMKEGGMKEDTLHGGRSPHERFEDEHYKGGHNDDLDHQAILGSKKEAAEFDKLSPEESKRRLRIIANRMDLNADGFVSKDELTAWIYKSLQMLDAEEVKDRFDEIDENKDSLISWDEYRDDAFGPGSVTDDYDLKMLKEDQRYFKAADSDKDGSLNEQEFTAFQNPEHHEHMHTTLIDLTLAEKDTNKDGNIDFKEFMGDVADQPDSEWYQVEKNRFEEDYDKNKDGTLDIVELKHWLVPNVQQTATDEMEHLFKDTDKDEDGKLSLDEIVEEHNLFVGSEATNYGEHVENMKEEL